MAQAALLSHKAIPAKADSAEGCSCKTRISRGGCAGCEERKRANPSSPSPERALRGMGKDLSRTPASNGVPLFAGPSKALGELGEEREQAKPPPMAGSATIKCDGKGGYEVLLNGWSGAKCGTKNCVIAHENSHKADWQAKWPDGCKNQPKGYLPKGDPPDKPLMTVAEYNAFLKKSECKAHTADLNCAKALPKPKGCKTTVDDYIKLTEKQRDNYCPKGHSTAAKVGIGLAVGGLAGAVVGAFSDVLF